MIVTGEIESLLLSAINVSVNEDFMQHCLDDVLYQQAIVTTDSLDTLGIHLVVLLRLRPIQSSIPFLANEQVRKVDFLEFELDWLNELPCHEVCCFASYKSIVTQRSPDAA